MGAERWGARLPVGSRGRRIPILLVVVAVMALLTGCSDRAGSSEAIGSGSDAPTNRTRAEDPGPPEVTAGPGDGLPAGRPGAGTPAFVLGTKDFSEQFLLGELYTQALRAKGYSVALQQNVGASELIDTAFASNQIQMYPEYLGEIATGLAPQLVDNTPLGIYRTASQFEQTQRAATILKQTPYQNIDVLVAERDFVDDHDVASIADLADIGPLRLAAQPSFRTRTNGLAGLEDVYGLSDVSFLAVSPDQTYEALDSGQVDVADAFSTDAQLRSGDYVEIDDPQHAFGYQYVAPVVKQETVRALGPEFAQTCNWVSSLLTVDAVRSMNEQVQLGGANEAEVARQFLASEGLR